MLQGMRLKWNHFFSDLERTVFVQKKKRLPFQKELCFKFFFFHPLVFFFFFFFNAIQNSRSWSFWGRIWGLCQLSGGTYLLRFMCNPASHPQMVWMEVLVLPHCRSHGLEVCSARAAKGETAGTEHHFCPDWGLNIWHVHKSWKYQECSWFQQDR